MMAVFVGGKLNGQTMTVEEVKAKHWNGELTMDWSEVRKRGGFCCNPILDNQPMVDGYLSPMLDGGKLRYETQEVYDMMFD